MQGRFKDEYIPTVIQNQNAKNVSILYSDTCCDGTEMINKVIKMFALNVVWFFAWVVMVVGVGGVRDGDNEVRFPDKHVGKLTLYNVAG